MPDNISDELVSGAEAARLLGKHPRTASRRATEAEKTGDRSVSRVGGVWVAPLSWWARVLKPKPMGRPKKYGKQTQ